MVCIDLHAGDEGWRVLQDIGLHACLKAKVRYTWAVWLAFDWCKQVKQVCQVSLTTVDGGGEKHKAG